MKLLTIGISLWLCLGITIAQDSLNIDPLIVTEDIDLFWKCYDQAQSNFKKNTFDPYLKEGSEGVKGFVHMRIESAKKLAQTVKKNQSYYEGIRPYSTRIRSTHSEGIEQVYHQMVDWYPNAVLPKVYFVMGRLNTGGTIKKAGLIMGAEMFGPQGADASVQARINFDYIPAIVAHELIHFQQNYPPSCSLLDQTIREGTADFVAYVIQGRPLNHHLDDWALPKSHTLWKQFKAAMDGKKYAPWMYTGTPIKGGPKDVGYWMGFQIAKAYYLKQEDPKQAVHDILNIQDFKQFLKDSGYNGSIPSE